MAENIDQTVRKAIEDSLAPDLRELKAQLLSFQMKMNERFDTFDKRSDAFSDELDSHFKGRVLGRTTGNRSPQ